MALLFLYTLYYTGPSYSLLGTDAVSGQAMCRAAQGIATGQIDCAIVGGASICFKESPILQLALDDLLSKSGVSRPFDNEGKWFLDYRETRIKQPPLEEIFEVFEAVKWAAEESGC